MTMNVPYEGGFLIQHKGNAPRHTPELNLLVFLKLGRPEGLAERYATIP